MYLVVNFHGNSDWEFLGIPKCNNSGSKKLEIPRKFQVYSQKDSEFLDITWNSNPEHQWLSLEAYKSKNLQEIPSNVQEFLWMFKNYWEFKEKIFRQLLQNKYMH